MLDVMSIILPLISVGLIVFFRYTDSRNVTVNTLKDYLKQSEKHIESMLQKKEKELNDRLIPAEIVMEKMHRMTVSIKDKLDKFDGDILRGDEIFASLRQESAVLQKELEEYRLLRGDFRGIEENISRILDIKQQSIDGNVPVWG